MLILERKETKLTVDYCQVWEEDQVRLYNPLGEGFFVCEVRRYDDWDNPRVGFGRTLEDAYEEAINPTIFPF